MVIMKYLIINVFQTYQTGSPLFKGEMSGGQRGRKEQKTKKPSNDCFTQRRYGAKYFLT